MNNVGSSTDAKELDRSSISDVSEEQPETYSSDFEDDENTKFVINIDHNVTLTVPEHLRDNFKHLKASVLSTDEKNKQFSTAHLPKDFRFISEVFKMRNTSTANDSQEKCFLTCSNKDAKQTMLTLPITRKYTIEEEIRFYDYSAWRHDGSKWSLLPVVYKAGYVEFSCGRLNYFGIVCCPRKIKNTVTPCGSSFDVGGNGQLTLTFEKECVKQNEDFIYKVEQHELNYGYSDKHKIIMNVSSRMNFEYDKSKFRKPIKVSLGGSNHVAPREEVVVLLIGYINGTITMRKRAAVQKDCTYVGRFKGLDGICFVTVKKKSDRNITDEMLTKELDLIYQRRSFCCLLLCYHKKIDTTLYFTAVCCLVCDKGDMKAKYKSNGDKLIFESNHLYLPTHQRMRIRPTSCIGTKPGMAAHFVFYFISASKDNSISFQVEAKRHIGGNPNAILEFSTDNKQNLEIAKAEFNLDSLLYQRKNKRTVLTLETDPPFQDTQNAVNDSESVVDISEEFETINTSISSGEEVECSKHAEEAYDDVCDFPTDEISSSSSSPEVPSTEIVAIPRDRYEQ